MADEAPTSFEEALSELEARVRALEAGDVDLETSLRLFEEGMALARQCQGQLDAAESRVVQLVRGAQGIEERPVDDVNDAS